MIKYIFAALIGYLSGSLSPAALVSKITGKDLREIGTKNLGATNVTLSVGKGFGAAVMVCDIAKAFIPYKLFGVIFRASPYIGMVAGAAAVVGHIFPFYLGFKGGKGLASFGGLVLAYDPRLFMLMLLTATALMLIVNYSFVMPFYAGIAFPMAIAFREHSVLAFALALLASVLLVYKHYPNMLRAKHGEDKKIRDYLKKQ